MWDLHEFFKDQAIFEEDSVLGRGLKKQDKILRIVLDIFSPKLGRVEDPLPHIGQLLEALASGYLDLLRNSLIREVPCL